MKRDPIAAALADFKSVDLSWLRPPPTDDGWAMAPDALRFLSSLARHLKPRHILEFGSGHSTRVLARACPRCAISSVDHDPEFALKKKAQVAPLVARDCGGKILPVYLLDPKRFASRRPVDLVVIDGPPVNLGGREGTLYQAMDFARAGTIVLLDDAGRAEEKAILQRWQESLGDAIAVRRLPGFSRGLAVVIVCQPVRRAELWAHRERLTQRDVGRLVPRGSLVISVGGIPLAPGRRVFSFMEDEGLPANDAMAIHEVERLRKKGAGFLAFAGHAFWWLDCYAGLARHLRERHRCLLENDRVVLFKLRR